jgi:hypothetical protein
LRWAAPLAVLAFLVGEAGSKGPWRFVWQQLNGIGPRDLESGVLLGVVALGLLIAIWIGARFLGQTVGYWREIIFDAQELQFTAHRHGWLFWGRRTVTIPFPRIRALWLSAGQEDRGPLPLELTLRYHDPREKLQRWSADFTLGGDERRAEALEFLFSIARLLGADGYTVREEAVRRQVWQLGLKGISIDGDAVPTAAEDDEDEDNDEPEERTSLLPIPGGWDRGGRHTASQGARPKRVEQKRASPVDLAALGEKIKLTRVADWQPGERVRFVRDRAPIGVFIAAGVFGALVAGGVGGWPVFGVLNGLIGGKVLWWPGTLALSALAGGCALTFIAWNQFQEREIEFDWRRRFVTLRLGADLQEWPFNRIRGLILAGTTRTEHEHQDRDSRDPPRVIKTEYGCRLELVVADRDVLLVESETHEPTADLARKVLEPLAASLAQALEIPCNFESYRTPDAATVRRVFTFSLPQQAVLATLAMTAVAAVGAAWWQARTRQNAVEAVRRQGGQIVWMSGYGMGQTTVYKDFWSVTFPNDPQVDAHLALLRPTLPELGDCGMDLRGTPLTDQGLAQLASLPALRILDLTETRVTDAGLEALSGCSGLVYLNLFGTSIGDESLTALTRLGKLRFLYLGGTRLTDAGLARLGELSSLEYVHVTGSQVTPTGRANSASCSRS